VSKKTTIVCDICGKHDDEDKMFCLSVAVDSQYDGTSTEDVTDKLDLCREHYDVAFGKAIKMLNTHQKKFLMDVMREIKGKLGGK
jgi:hypothetical protein